MADDQKFQRGTELVVTIENSAFEGKSIARVGTFVIFIEGGVPGDTANVRIQRVKKNYAEASIIDILKPSTNRTSPRCQYFGVCGGCKWQHVRYETQLQFKQQHVLDAFERIGGFRDLPIQPILGAEEQYFYRNKMEFSFSRDQWKWEKMTESDVPLFLGLHVPQRYDKVLDIHECFLQSERSNTILNATRAFARKAQATVYDSKENSGFLRFLVIREAKYTDQILVNLVTYDTNEVFLQNYTTMLRSVVPSITTVVNTVNRRKAQIASGEEEYVFFGNGTIEERIGKYRFIISAGSFFQTNSRQTERLYEVVKTIGAFTPQDVVYDLYCGTGTIGIYLSDAVEHVVGIEIVESAIRDAVRNAELNGVKNCTFIQGDLKERLTNDTAWMKHTPKPTVLVIDPPRTGMHPKVIERILEILPERIVYVSCNPTTQARDAQFLSHRYTLAMLQPVDMFPHTYHVENVALLIQR